MKTSLNREQVDEALSRRQTNLATFIEAGREQGKTLEEIWADLRSTTGVRFSVRTFYRWAEQVEKVAS